MKKDNSLKTEPSEPKSTVKKQRRDFEVPKLTRHDDLPVITAGSLNLRDF